MKTSALSSLTFLSKSLNKLLVLNRLKVSGSGLTHSMNHLSVILILLTVIATRLPSTILSFKLRPLKACLYWQLQITSNPSLVLNSNKFQVLSNTCQRITQITHICKTFYRDLLNVTQKYNATNSCNTLISGQE